MNRHEKQRRTERRVTFAFRLLRNGFPLEEAARPAYISEERLQRALGIDHRKQLMEGETQMTEPHDHKTTLGTTSVPYRTEAGEELIAERMRQLSASGRPAERMDVIRELASKGELAVYQDTHDFEEELQRSIPPEKRTPRENAPSEGAGRTLAEGMAIAAAGRAVEWRIELYDQMAASGQRYTA
jgi:hypothetical protein